MKYDIEPYFGNDAKKKRKFDRDIDIAHRIEEYVNSGMPGKKVLCSIA